MESLADVLLDIKAVKAVKRQGENVFKIELFTREIPNSENVEIRGDLRAVAPKIRSALEKARENGEIEGWNWIEKPEKKYQSRSLGTNVSDRKEKGYRPGYYLVSIKS